MPVSGADIIVVLVGLFAGYFLVSWLIGRRGGDGEGNAESTRRPNHGQGYWRDRDEPSAHDNGVNAGSARTWYEVLKVPAYASLDEVKLAYRRRIVEYHPDKTSNLGDELRMLAESKTKEINAAYDTALRAFGKRRNPDGQA
jgi:DnaJ-domain-containing protein 1